MYFKYDRLLIFRIDVYIRHVIARTFDILCVCIVFLASFTPKSFIFGLFCCKYVVCAWKCVVFLYDSLRISRYAYCFGLFCRFISFVILSNYCLYFFSFFSDVALPFLTNTQVFFWYPSITVGVLWLFSTVLLVLGLRLNMTRIVMAFHYG